MQSRHLCTWFLRSIVAILVTTAIAKAVTITQVTGSLDASDELLFFLTKRQLLFVTCAIELGVSIFLLRKDRSIGTKLAAVIWLTAIFGMYRIGLKLAGIKASCSCLGRMSEWLPISTAHLSTMTLVLLGYMALGSSSLLVQRHFNVATRQQRFH